MKAAKEKTKKDTVINFRATRERKEKIQSDAKALGMTVAEYLLYLTEHRQVVVVTAGKELAEAIYDLNAVLKHYEKYPFLPVQELQDCVSHGIDNINHIMKEGIPHVDIEN